MKIGPNAVVAIDYTLTDDGGQVLDSNEGEEPLTYLHGHGQIVAGLESALDGKAKGDKFKTTVSPKDGYGEPHPERNVRVPRDELPDDPTPEIGMELEASGPDGQVTHLWIVGVEKDDVLLSTDHPLAGVTLHFDVNVRDVREATKEELEHGHAHDGHEHEDDGDDGHGHAH